MAMMMMMEKPKSKPRKRKSKSKTVSIQEVYEPWEKTLESHVDRSCSKIINTICKNTIKKNKIKTTFFSQLNHCYCWSLFQRSRRSIILSLRDIGCQKSAGSSSGFGRLILIRVAINFNLQYFAEFLSIEFIEEDVNDGIDEGMWPTQKVHSYM